MAELPKAVSDYLAKIGGRGGKAKVSKGFGALTPEQRSANAKKAAAKRWGKKKPGKVKRAGK